MAFKIKVLSVLLVICLIDSLHSASYERKKRDATEATTEAKATHAEESTTEHGSTDSTTSKGGDSGNPMDVNKIVDNIGQMFSVGQSSDWMNNANSWFTNIPSMPSWLGGGSGGDSKS